MKSLCHAPLPPFRISLEVSALVRLEKMHFSTPFQAKSNCLPQKEGSEPVKITHHTLGSVKVTFSNT